MIMAVSVIFQAIAGMWTGNADASDSATPANQAKSSFSYEDAVEKQREEGGPRRYYDDGELDIASARVADEDGTPITTQEQAYERTHTHVNVMYCIS